MRTFLAAGIGALLLLSGCGKSGADQEATFTAASAAPATSVTTAAPTTTTEPPTTTTMALPAPPTFVVICPPAASTGYFGKPWDVGLGYQYWVGTDAWTLDISWGDGKASRFTSWAAFGKARHPFEPGQYQVNAMLTDAYGRTATSSCNISWKDTLPDTMHSFDCAMRDNQITTWENGHSTSIPDPACSR